MADYNSIFDDDPFSGSYGDEETALTESFTERNRAAGFRAARQRVKRYEQLFERTGIEAPEEDTTRGFIGELFDTLDTGGQFVRGVMAKAAGMGNYKSDSYLSAGIRGTEEDLTVGDIFREQDFLEDSPIWRAGLGFVGDVVTDPLMYLTGGASTVARTIAGKSLKGAAAVEKAGGGFTTIDKLIRAKKIKEAVPGIKKIRKAQKAGKLPETAVEGLVSDVRMAAERETFKHLGYAASIVKDEKKFARIDVKSAADKALRDQYGNFELKKQIVTDYFGLPKDTNFDTWFYPAAVRFTSPFAGAKFIKKVPILKERLADIPLFTPATAKAFEFLGGKLFNMNVATKKTIGDLAAIPGVAGAIPRAMKDLGARGRGAASLFSRRIAAGGKAQSQILKEFEAQAVGAHAAGRKRADDFLKARDWSDEELNLMTSVLDIERGMHKDITGATVRQGPGAVGEISTKHTEKFFESTLAKHKAELNSIDPGRGDDFEKVLRGVKNLYKEFGEENIKDGNILDAIEGYLNIVIKGKDDIPMNPRAVKELSKSVKPEDFMHSRKSLSVAEMNARKTGHAVETNLKEILSARITAQIKAKANKHYMERLGFEVGVDPRAWAEVQALASIHNPKRRTFAARLLEAKGFRLSDVFYQSPESFAGAERQILKKRGAEEAKIVPMGILKTIQEYRPFQHYTGIQVAPGDFDNMVAAYERGGKEGAKAVRDAKAAGFDIADKTARTSTRRKIEKDWRTLNDLSDPNSRGVFQFLRNKKDGRIFTEGDYNQMLRLSKETVVDPKTGKEVLRDSARLNQRELERMGIADIDPDVMRADLKAAEKLYSDTQDQMIHLNRGGKHEFEMSGLETVSDRFWGRVKGNLSAEDQLFYEGVLPRPMNQAIEESLDTRSTIERLRQAGAKGDGMARAMTGLAEPYLGWVKAHKMMSTIMWPAYLVRNFGSAQFQQMQSASTLGEALNLGKLYETYNVALKGKAGRFIQEGTGDVIPFYQIRNELKALNLEVEAKHFLELAEGQKETLSFMGTGKLPTLAKKAWGGYTNFTKKIENFGRQQLYIQQRVAGNSASEAAANTSRIMVDYSRGKTRFEQNWMNNTIFFYSFARGQATNTFTQMVQRPGALTAQLHAVEGVKEALINGDTDYSPDYIQEIQTLRSKETISRYLGKDEAGVDQLLTGVGLPAEELSRFINIHVPTEFTAGGVMDAAGMTARRTFQTAISAVNPTLKGAIEYLGANRSFFFDRPLDDKMMRRFPKFESDMNKFLPFPTGAVPEDVWKSIDSGLQKLLDGQPNGDGTVTISPHMMAVLSYLIPGAGRAVSTHNYLAKKGPDRQQKLLRALTGVKITEIEPESARVFERAKVLEDELKQIFGTSSKKKIKQTLALIELNKRRGETIEEE